MNSQSNITAYAFSNVEHILPSTTHIVLRHATGYYRKPNSFTSLLRLLDERKIETINPTRLIRWNMNKQYLEDLLCEKIRFPDTLFFRKGDPTLPDVWQNIKSLLNLFSKGSFKTGSIGGRLEYVYTGTARYHKNQQNYR